MNHSQSAKALASSELALSKSARRQALRALLARRESETGRQPSETFLAAALTAGLSEFPGVWLAYRGFSSEVRLPEAPSNSVVLAYPVVEDATQMRFYRPVTAAVGGGSFLTDRHGIETPELAGGGWQVVAAESDATVVGALVPALGFDRMGGRLGRGRGYYDRFLSETDAKRKAQGLTPLLKIGIGFHEQVVEELPCEKHDVKLDAVLTDREWITPVKGAENE